MRTIQSIVVAFALAALVAHASTTPPLPRSASTGSLGRVQGNGPPSTPPSPTSSRTDSAEITKKSKKPGKATGGSPSSSTSQSPALSRSSSGDQGKKPMKKGGASGDPSSPPSSSPSNAQSGDSIRPPLVVPNAAMLNVPQTAFHYPTVSLKELQAPVQVFTLKNQVVGIIPQLYGALEEANSVAIIVSPHTPFVTQGGLYDHDWGCGYHNLQVLLAPIVRLEKMKVTQRNKPVAGRVGESPEYTHLQDLLNLAHGKGFDRGLDGKCNTDRAEGAYRLETADAAAALSYLGIKNTMYQFEPPQLMHFAEWYFTMAAKIDYGGNALKTQRIIVLSRPAIFLNYGDGNDGTAGHSLAIVGFEHGADGKKYLLLFDSMLTSLDRKTQAVGSYLGKFRKSLADLDRLFYDVIVVGDEKWTLGKVNRKTDGVAGPISWAGSFDQAK